MRTITIFYDGTSFTYSWIKTLIWARKEFQSFNVKVEFANKLDYFPIIELFFNRFLKTHINDKREYVRDKHYDIVFLAFHHSTSEIGHNISKRQELLKFIRERSEVVCWLDTADSTGSCLFDVLPYVDYYFKKQILKDKTLYLNSFYLDRIYCQYYHDKYGINSNEIGNSQKISQNEDLKKIKISWNMSLSDNYDLKKLYLLRPYSMKFKTYTLPLSDKTIDVHYGGANPRVYGELVGFQRSEMLKRLNQISNITHPDVYKKIGREEYLNELLHSKAILSPFGWGEVCFRDFESFIYCSTLLKPSMSHCKTFPDLYVENETYVPMSWDFSDFDEIIEKVGSDDYRRIAETGQERYKQFVSGPNAKKYFVEHLISVLGL